MKKSIKTFQVPVMNIDEVELDFSFPVFRFGCVLLSDSDTDPWRSTQAAKEIDENQGRWIDLLKGAIEENLKATSVNVANQRIKWRTRLGYDVLQSEDQDMEIADFPLINIEFSKYNCDFRACLTLCKSSKKSKLWYRVSCKEVDGKPATRISKEDSFYFFKQVTAAKIDILKSMREEYERVLKKAGITASFIPFNASILALNLELYGDLPFKKHDERQRYEELASSLVKNSIYSQPDKKVDFRDCYSRKIRINYRGKINSSILSLIDYTSPSHIFEFKPEHDELSFIIICPGGFSRTENALIESNDDIRDFENILRNDPLKIENLYSASCASESSRQLLLEFGRLF